jgi:hypothetical protein
MASSTVSGRLGQRREHHQIRLGKCDASIFGPALQTHACRQSELVAQRLQARAPAHRRRGRAPRVRVQGGADHYRLPERRAAAERPRRSAQARARGGRRSPSEHACAASSPVARADSPGRLRSALPARAGVELAHQLLPDVAEELVSLVGANEPSATRTRSSIGRPSSRRACSRESLDQPGRHRVPDEPRALSAQLLH